MIMVFKVCAVLEAMQKLCPTMYSRFTPLLDAIETADETKITEEIYQTLEPLNFSTAFLEKFADTSPDMLSVLPVLQVSWSDWGSPKRLLHALELLGRPAQRVNRQRRSSVPAHTQRKNNRRDTVPWRRRSLIRQTERHSRLEAGHQLRFCLTSGSSTNDRCTTAHVKFPFVTSLSGCSCRGFLRFVMNGRSYPEKFCESAYQA